MNYQIIHLPSLLSWLQPIDFPRKLGICERLFGHQISQYGICWTNTGAGIPWQLDLNNPTHRWIVYGKYEGAEFLNWAQSFLPDNGIVVDSGASIGQMSMYLGQYVPQGKVLAFEPGQEATNWLRECLSVNQHLPVQQIQAGLGNKKSQMRLVSLGDDHQHGAQNQVTESFNESSLGETIEIITLTEQLQALNIDHVDLWCLDIEGYEIPALEGAAELLQNHQIRAIYAELSGENSQKVRNYLDEFGYQCYLIKNGKLHIPESFPDHTNGLFLKRSA